VDALPGLASFVVRVSRQDTLGLAGTVERVRTGERHRFQDAAALVRLIEALVEQERAAEAPASEECRRARPD
jgi:hypothetical protein